MNTVLRRLLLVCCCLIPRLACGAGLDPEVDKPYKLEVVLSIGKHRLLTDEFREQIERELSDGLQAGAGDLVEVRVLRTHPTLKDIERKGLAATLKEFKGTRDTKTHFVRIDYVEGEYEIQAQQYDGMTGMFSPVLRKKRTSDRQFVARLATLFIADDFGPVATVIDGKDVNNVKIQFKGARKGKSDVWKRWVSKGELLLVTSVLQGGKGVRLVPDAVLQLEDKDPKDEDVWIGRVHHRFANPLSQPNATGNRCLRIATVKTALQLRVVQRDAKQLTPVPNLGIEVRKSGFDENRDKVERVTDREGYVRLPTVYERLVFVTAQTKPNSALIPIPLVDEEPVTVSVIVRNDARSLLALRTVLWEQQLNEANAAQSTIFKELAELNTKPELRDKAVDAARKGVQHAEQVLKDLGNDQKRLADDAKNSGEKVDLSYGEQFMTRLEKGKKELEEYIVAQEKIIKEEIPKQKKRLERIEEGKLADCNCDFEKALAIYDEVLKDGHQDEGLKKHYEELKTEWKITTAEHVAARKYFYETWPDVEIAKMKDALPEVSKSLKACRTAKDRLTPQKFLQASVVHAGKIKEQLDALNPTLNEDDVKPAEELANLAKELQKLIAEAQKDLQTK